MKVLDVMSRDVETVPAAATVQEAALQMAEGDYGAVLVTEGAALAGILTDRDIILRSVVEGLDVTRTSVRRIMSSTLFTCRAEDDVAEAFRAMSERQVRRLPVLDDEGTLVGIVTMSDLARHERDAAQAGAALRDIADPHRVRQSAGPDDEGS